MTLDDLRTEKGAGHPIGTIANGILLSPDTMRKIACDAGVIPTLLGSESEILDHGRQIRCFSTSQLHAL